MADLHSLDLAAPSNGGAAGRKRQRRPSVRLGDMGSAVNPDSHLRRSKQLKIPGDQSGKILMEGNISRPNWINTPEEGYRDSEANEDLCTPLKEDSIERNSSQKEENAGNEDSSMGFGLWGHPRSRSQEDGSVRAWLNGLGLGRYVPVFQIHEVDDEVLPFLTLEDLKEMGITAVGSRRKIFFAIQKLGKRETAP